MSRFNTAVTPRPPVVADTHNLAGGRAYALDPKVELVTILLTSMVSDQFYRSANDTLARVTELLKSVDPKFAAKLAIFARDEFGMRSITHATAATLAATVKGETWTKDFFNKIVVRPDDMTEILAYYYANFGRNEPNSLRKGFALAFNRMDSYKLAKYRGEGKSVSLVDVVNVVHPKPTNDKARAALAGLVNGTLRNTDTWEAKVSAAGPEGKAEAWADMLRSGKLGYFALLRNLRNIEQLNDDELVKLAATQLVEDDPGSHRILPFRFLSAYNEVSNPRLLKAVSDALDRAVVNTPELPGKTLIVIDHSGSMGDGHGSPKFIGDTFAAIVFKANPDADVMVFGTNAGYVPRLNPADSVLTLANRIGGVNHGYGTSFQSIYSTAKRAYDRFMIFSDMQAWVGYYAADEGMTKTYENKFKASPFHYAFDLAGYGTSQFSQTGRRIQLAGFSEKIFDTVKFIESDPQALIKRIEAVEL